METMTWQEAINLPALTLAYIGDGIYEIGVRRYLLSKNVMKVEELHRTAVHYVKATFQSRFYQLLAETLPERELAVMKRGRNAKTGHQPKSSGVLEYHNATGVEALFGALWLSGEKDRLDALFTELYAFIEKDEEETK
jgi:ribonuclease-3 family protein